MTITRQFHFHAAHRNQHLTGSKCFNLHGHTYYLSVTIAVDAVNSQSGVAVAFDEIETQVRPLIETLDHSLLLQDTDPLYEHLRNFVDSQEHGIRVVKIDRATSVENLIDKIHSWLCQHTTLRVKRLRLQETTSTYVEAEYPV